MTNVVWSLIIGHWSLIIVALARCFGQRRLTAFASDEQATTGLTIALSIILLAITFAVNWVLTTVQQRSRRR